MMQSPAKYRATENLNKLLKYFTICLFLCAFWSAASEMGDAKVKKKQLNNPICKKKKEKKAIHHTHRGRCDLTSYSRSRDGARSA